MYGHGYGGVTMYTVIMNVDGEHITQTFKSKEMAFKWAGDMMKRYRNEGRTFFLHIFGQEHKALLSYNHYGSYKYEPKGDTIH